MELRRVLFGQVLRYFQISGPAGGNVYGLYITREFEKRYGFREGPRAVDDFNLEKGVTFLHGYFQDRVVIDRCQIFHNGIIVESKAPIEEWEGFVDDLMSWADGSLGVKMGPWPNAARGYFSQLEVVCSKKLGETINQFGDVTGFLAEMLKSYGQPELAYEPTQISFHIDLTNVPYPKPNAFTFARREEQPYSSNIYFSSAPLKTGDHIRLLEIFEKVLA